MNVTHDEYLDIFLETLIKTMIKQGYATISIDQMMLIREDMKKHPLESLKN